MATQNGDNYVDDCCKREERGEEKEEIYNPNNSDRHEILDSSLVRNWLYLEEEIGLVTVTRPLIKTEVPIVLLLLTIYNMGETLSPFRSRTHSTRPVHYMENKHIVNCPRILCLVSFLCKFQFYMIRSSFMYCLYTKLLFQQGKKVRFTKNSAHF